jgi:hypothetical protein
MHENDHVLTLAAKHVSKQTEHFLNPDHGGSSSNNCRSSVCLEEKH